jgi:hypothetical protein
MCRHPHAGGAVKKSDVIKLLDDMPEEIDIEKLMYTLYVRRQIELGLASADAGDVISDEEFDVEMAQWDD